MMMNRRKSSVWAKSRILLAVPIIAFLLMCFGFQANSQSSNLNETAKSSKGMLFNVDADETTEFFSINPDGNGISILQDSTAFEVSEDLKTVVFYSKDNSQTLSWSLEDQTAYLSTPQDPQKGKTPQKDEEVFVIVDKVPEYPGGDEARLDFLRENVKYPPEAKEKGIQGTVYVYFIVEKDGTVTNVKVARGVDKLIDDEAIRVTKMMPKWTPGKQKGKDVRVSYNMPIRFTLSADAE
jgi:TonB family protein